jgi:hypothetical protein
LVIHQSPTILSSSRGGGTTGAGQSCHHVFHYVYHIQFILVVWKITPRFASWITDSKSPFFAHDILKSTSSVLELGCGISGIIGLVLGPHIGSYTLSDQGYVSKLVNQNLLENRIGSSSSKSGRKSNVKSKKMNVDSPSAASEISNISFKSLDWETDQVSSVAGRGNSYDVVIACDCIYNDALIVPLVQTCVDSCRLRSENSAIKATKSSTDDGEEVEPTVCVIAQQLRSDEVFEAWLKEFHRSFHVWRVPDEVLMEGLREDSGFVVHIGVLR